jgi:hypothetical protein
MIRKPTARERAGGDAACGLRLPACGAVSVPFWYKRRQVSTALVPITPTDREAPAAYGNNRPSADFLAQLIAISEKTPQTRMRRRAEPQEVIAAYRARGRSAVPSGRALSRSL